jgi:hypothetical protein
MPLYIRTLDHEIPGEEFKIEESGELSMSLVSNFSKDMSMFNTS